VSKRSKIPEKLQSWTNARKKYHLSHAHIQMARELGMNPTKLGGKANHDQEAWKVPLPVFIEELYFKRFGKKQPDKVKSIEQIVREKIVKKEKRRRRRLLEKEKVEASAAGFQNEQTSAS